MFTGRLIACHQLCFFYISVFWETISVNRRLTKKKNHDKIIITIDLSKVYQALHKLSYHETFSFKCANTYSARGFSYSLAHISCSEECKLLESPLKFRCNFFRRDYSIIVAFTSQVFFLMI
jgi:hypothetical protein